MLFLLSTVSLWAQLPVPPLLQQSCHSFKGNEQAALNPSRILFPQAEYPPSPAILNPNSAVHGEEKEQVDRWRGLESLDSDSATATGDLLQQDLLYGKTAGAELEMLEQQADLWG